MICTKTRQSLNFVREKTDPPGVEAALLVEVRVGVSQLLELHKNMRRLKQKVTRTANLERQPPRNLSQGKLDNLQKRAESRRSRT